ncbi:MAG: HdeD family acid-resistance protein [Actinomycetota bacterium]|nr:HdeD family acid-resistance protein [Actinomycetota bacterium]
MGLNFTVVIVHARMWWTYILRGLLAIIFGIVAFLAPGFALGTLVILFAVWMLIDGAGALVNTMQARGKGSWWLGLIEGIAGIVAGVVALFWPDITALVLLLLIGSWAIVTGVLEVWAAIRLRAIIQGELFLALSGILSVLFGLYVIVFPGLGVYSVLWLIGFFGILYGLTLISLGWRLRRIYLEAKGHGEYAERGMRP